MVNNRGSVVKRGCRGGISIAQTIARVSGGCRSPSPPPGVIWASGFRSGVSMKYIEIYPGVGRMSRYSDYPGSRDRDHVIENRPNTGFELISVTIIENLRRRFAV